MKKEELQKMLDEKLSFYRAAVEDLSLINKLLLLNKLDKAEELLNQIRS